MEFDDATLWPSSDLQRLDDLEIDDELISFSINLSIHPLDHGAALVLRDNKKGTFSIHSSNWSFCGPSDVVVLYIFCSAFAFRCSLKNPNRVAAFDDVADLFAGEYPVSAGL